MGIFERLWAKPKEAQTIEEPKFVSVDPEKLSHLGVGECIYSGSGGTMRCVTSKTEVDGEEGYLFDVYEKDGKLRTKNEPRSVSQLLEQAHILTMLDEDLVRESLMKIEVDQVMISKSGNAYWVSELEGPQGSGTFTLVPLNKSGAKYTNKEESKATIVDIARMRARIDRVISMDEYLKEIGAD